jgi:predicted ATPase
VPTFLGLLAEAYAKSGRPDDGLEVVADALAMAERTGAHYWDAELRRLQGALVLQSAAAVRGAAGKRRREAAESEAESSFLAAIEVARRQQARSLELRAATSLARLWRGQQRTAEARELLSQTCRRFTEGFEEADLVEARGMLDAIGGE